METTHTNTSAPIYSQKIFAGLLFKLRGTLKAIDYSLRQLIDSMETAPPYLNPILPNYLSSSVKTVQKQSPVMHFLCPPIMIVSLRRAISLTPKIYI